MKWKLIFLLSLFGLVMGVLTVYWIPGNIEILFWLPIFIVCAFIIAKKCSSKYFLHGFLISILNCVWVTSAHIIHYQTYIAHHTQEAEMVAHFPSPMNIHPRMVMAIMGPFFGIIFGLILGLFSWVASKIVKK